MCDCDNNYNWGSRPGGPGHFQQAPQPQPMVFVIGNPGQQQCPPPPCGGYYPPPYPSPGQYPTGYPVQTGIATVGSLPLTIPLSSGGFGFGF